MVAPAVFAAGVPLPGPKQPHRTFDSLVLRLRVGVLFEISPLFVSKLRNFSPTRERALLLKRQNRSSGDWAVLRHCSHRMSQQEQTRHKNDQGPQDGMPPELHGILPESVNRI